MLTITRVDMVMMTRLTTRKEATVLRLWITMETKWRQADLMKLNTKHTTTPDMASTKDTDMERATAREEEVVEEGMEREGELVDAEDTEGTEAMDTGNSTVVHTKATAMAMTTAMMPNMDTTTDMEMTSIMTTTGMMTINQYMGMTHQGHTSSAISILDLEEWEDTAESDGYLAAEVGITYMHG